MTDKAKKKGTGWFEGSGNIFADLGLPDAEEHDLKAQIAIKLNDAISQLNCSQAEIAKKLGIKQPHVSQITNYKLQGFSVERLMLFIVKLGHSLTIEVSADPTPSPSLSVVTHVPAAIETAAYVGDIYDAIATVWIGTRSHRGVSHPLGHKSKKYVPTPQREPWALTPSFVERRTADFSRSTRTLQ